MIIKQDQAKKVAESVRGCNKQTGNNYVLTNRTVVVNMSNGSLQQKEYEYTYDLVH